MEYRLLPEDNRSACQAIHPTRPDFILMHDSLKIVKGAVAKKDLVPVLTHLHIHHGWVSATNGKMTITLFIEELVELDIIVPAAKFIAAINRCKKPKFKILENGEYSSYRILYITKLK